MFGFAPKFYHLVVSIFVLVAFVAAGGGVQGRLLMACNLGAAAFGIVAVALLFMLALESLNRRVEVMTDFANAIGKLDDEARAMMAFEFPTMRYRMKRGELREMFEDTSVPIELFRLFLQTSNSKYISPERDWNTKDRPRWVWIEIKKWLEEHDHIIPDSAAGSHSWLWKGSAYQHLMAYWMAGRRVVDLDDTRVYAYSAPPPLEEDA